MLGVPIQGDSVSPEDFLAVGIWGGSPSPWESQILSFGGDSLSPRAAGSCPHGALGCGIAEADRGGAAEDRG